MKDIRWKQRFQNFEKAYVLLEQAVAIKNTTEIERAGLIKYFEVCFELSWKTLKDYLEDQGFVLKTPRDVLKQAFQSDFIEDGHAWMAALEDRNLTSHTYNKALSLELETRIKTIYYLLLKNLYIFLKAEAQQ